MKEYSNDELLQKAAGYCSIAEHCLSEVENKLTAWGCSDEIRPKITDRLQEEGFIDEQRYCNAFVSDKIRYAKWGKIKIIYMLRGKQIDESYINNAIQRIDEDEYQKILFNILQAKQCSIKGEGHKKKEKLYRFAQSRGFENSIINKILRNI